MRTTARVTLGDLAEGAAALAADAGGRPVRPGVVVDLDDADWDLAPAVVAALTHPTTVVVGISTRALPAEASPVAEALTMTLAPDGPGRAWAGSPDDLPVVEETLASSPVAGVMLAGVLRAGAKASVPDAMVLESTAYSALLAGREFRSWRQSAMPRRGEPVPSPVRLTREDDRLTITLDHAERHNAFGRAMRDAFVEALELAEQDPSIRVVRLEGNGPSFCSGGDLAEFGTAKDPAAAHLVRLQRSAGLAVHRVAERAEAVLHGACIGAGIEVPAFAGRVLGREGAWFQLPELSLGLIPGAGGTVSIPRRIGRWRTAYLALTGRALDLETALEWGLVDERC